VCLIEIPYYIFIELTFYRYYNMLVNFGIVVLLKIVIGWSICNLKFD